MSSALRHNQAVAVFASTALNRVHWQRAGVTWLPLRETVFVENKQTLRKLAVACMTYLNCINFTLELHTAPEQVRKRRARDGKPPLLAYYTVEVAPAYRDTALPTAVVLEWSTASEVDVAGFDLAVKPVSAPDSAYQPLGFVPAVGGPSADAIYSFPVTALDIGVAYCFRLSERTTTGAPGEVLDRCGYGPGVTPTPAATPDVVPGTPPTPGDPVTPATKPISVPEPLTLLLFGAGLAGIGVAVRRRRRG